MKILIAFLMVFFSLPAYAKTLTIITQAHVGQPYMNAKILSKYLQRHHPEITNVVMRVVPGAGGLNAANFLYNIADRDGYTIGTFTKITPLRGIVGGSNINFDPSGFTWLGSTSDGRNDVTVLISTKPYNNNELILAEMSFGEISLVDMVERATGWNFKKVTGYKNNVDAKLAVLRREVDGMFVNFHGMLASDPEWESIVVMQLGNGGTRLPRLAHVPTLFELVNDKSMLPLIEAFELSSRLSKPFVAPPGIPERQAKLLREAFIKAVNDPDYIEETNKLNFEVTLIDWKESEDIIRKLKGLDRSILEQLN